MLLIPLERGILLGVLIPLKQEQFLFYGKYYSNKGTIPFDLQSLSQFVNHYIQNKLNGIVLSVLKIFNFC